MLFAIFKISGSVEYKYFYAHLTLIVNKFVWPKKMCILIANLAKISQIFSFCCKYLKIRFNRGQPRRSYFTLNELHNGTIICVWFRRLSKFGNFARVQTAVSRIKFATRLWNRKLFAYRKFAINVEFPGAKLQGRRAKQKLSCRFTFTSVYFHVVQFWPELLPRFSATCISLDTRGCLRRYGSRHLRSVRKPSSDAPTAA